jgi:hypothetical protein
MALVVDIFRKHLPYKKKQTPSGWISFDAPCCHHRGENTDTRQRGGVKFSDGLVFNCFNCGYTASWKPGRQISQKLRQLMIWLGAPDDDINIMVFEAMKSEGSTEDRTPDRELIDFANKDLPEGALPISEWIDQELDQELDSQLAEVVSYLVGRDCDPLDPRFYWTPLDIKDRVIVPFTYGGRVVGWTARKVRDGKPKYLSDQHPNFVFNLDAITQDQRYLFVVEGPFDAMAVKGVALLHNEISENQARLINKMGKEVIVIPDQDRAGSKLIEHALKWDWSVAFPNWSDDVKDCSDAVKKYGSLFVAVDAIKTAQQGAIRINLYKNKFDKKVHDNV